MQLTNDSTKNYMIELVPPNLKISGLLINPLVTELKAGKSSLVCIRYNSDFRDLTYARMQELFRKDDFGDNIPGIGIKNKKLDQRLKKEKEEADSKAALADPKAAAKGGAKPGPPAAAPKKEEAKKVDPKAAKKTPQQEEEERLEAERKIKEAEDAETARLQALEDAFDKHAELKTMGGKVFDFEKENKFKRTQHYEWLLPVFYKCIDEGQELKKMKTFYIEARTTTVPRTLVANVETLDFGEIPVAMRVVKEILIKNVGILEETLKLQSLTPYGGFTVLNALRPIAPGETRGVIV